MKQWWRGLQLRERLVVLVAAGLLSLLALDSFVISPWIGSGEALSGEIEQARDDLAWMEQAVRRLPAGGRKPVAVAGGNLVTRINRLTGQSGLRSQMKQMKPIGEREVRLRFEKAAFGSLVGLLKEVERQELEIKELRILPTDESGRVNATLVVRQGG